MYGSIPPWHLHITPSGPGLSASMGHTLSNMHSDFPEMQLPGLVHLGLLSVQPRSRKQVFTERKSKKVKSVQPGVLQLYQTFDK